MKTLSQCFHISERGVRRLAEKGIIPKSKNGNYELAECAERYILHLLAKAEDGKIDPGSLQERKLKAETEKEEANAELKKIQLAEEQGRLLRRDDILQRWGARLIEFKSAMLQLPKRVSFRFADPEMKEIVEEEVYAFAIEALAKYSRDGAILPVDELGGGDISGAVEAAEGANGQPMG